MLFWKYCQNNQLYKYNLHNIIGVILLEPKVSYNSCILTYWW